MMMSCFNWFVFVFSFVCESRNLRTFERRFLVFGINPNIGKLCVSFLHFLEKVMGYLLIVGIFSQIFVGQYQEINVSLFGTELKRTMKGTCLVCFSISFLKVVEVMERVFSGVLKGPCSCHNTRILVFNDEKNFIAINTF